MQPNKVLGKKTRVKIGDKACKKELISLAFERDNLNNKSGSKII